MTRERVEQAIGVIAEALREFHAGAGYPDHYYAEDLNHALEALTTLSNALAESEKERERLREAAGELLAQIDNPGSVIAVAAALTHMRQALSPDSQEKREE